MITSDYQAYQNIWKFVLRDLSSDKFLESYHYCFAKVDVLKTENQGSSRLSDWVLETITTHLNKLGYQTFYRSIKRKKRVVYELKISFPSITVSNIHEDQRMEYIAVSTLFKKRTELIQKYKKRLLDSVKKYIKSNIKSDDALFKFENIPTEVTRYVVSYLNENFKKISFRYLKTIHLVRIDSCVRKLDYIRMTCLKEKSRLPLSKTFVTVRFL